MLAQMVCPDSSEQFGDNSELSNNIIIVRYNCQTGQKVPIEEKSAPRVHCTYICTLCCRLLWVIGDSIYSNGSHMCVLLL